MAKRKQVALVDALLPNAVTASATTNWNPQLHFTGDWNEDRRAVADILRRHGAFVVAYFFYHPFPGFYSLELQFAGTPEARQAMAAARAEYQSLPT